MSPRWFMGALVVVWPGSFLLPLSRGLASDLGGTFSFLNSQTLCLLVFNVLSQKRLYSVLYLVVSILRVRKLIRHLDAYGLPYVGYPGGVGVVVGEIL
jgi:hypothetical protein